METLLLVLLIAAAGLACPAMMWWRRDRDPACSMPARVNKRSRDRDQPVDVEELRLRHDRLTTRIAELEADEKRDVMPSDALSTSRLAADRMPAGDRP